jgi:hypothetical protein
MQFWEQILTAGFYLAMNHNEEVSVNNFIHNQQVTKNKPEGQVISLSDRFRVVAE